MGRQLASAMLPKSTKAAMKAPANQAMTKTALAAAIASKHELKKSVCSKLITNLVSIATNQVKKMGVFAIPGVVRLKTRVKPATKAGTRKMFGKEIAVKAKPAKTVVKAFPVAALKKSI